MLIFNSQNIVSVDKSLSLSDKSGHGALSSIRHPIVHELIGNSSLM